MEIITIKKASVVLKKNIKKGIFAIALTTVPLTLTGCRDKNTNKEVQQVILKKYKSQYNLSKSSWAKKYADDILVIDSDQEIQESTFLDILEILDNDLVELEIESEKKEKRAEQFIKANPKVLDSIKNRFLYELIMQPIDASSKYTSQVQIFINKNVVTINEQNRQVIAIVPTDETSLSNIIKNYNINEENDTINNLKELYQDIKDIEDSGYYYGNRLYTQNEGIATNKELDYYTLKSSSNKKLTK